MRKAVLYFSLLVNVFFLAAAWWAIRQYGGWSAVWHRIRQPGQEVQYEQRKDIYRQFPVKAESVIFLGNSLTAGGEWAEWFADGRIVNRGIPGDHCEGIRRRLTDALGPAPKAVFLMAGVNDLAYHPPDTVFRRYDQLVAAIQEQAPTAQLILQNVLPVCGEGLAYVRNGDICRLNAQIEKLAEKLDLSVVDLHRQMCDVRGQLRSELTTDGVHLNGVGYRLWFETIRPFVLRQLSEGD